MRTEIRRVKEQREEPDKQGNAREGRTGALPVTAVGFDRDVLPASILDAGMPWRYPDPRYASRSHAPIRRPQRLRLD